MGSGTRATNGLMESTPKMEGHVIFAQGVVKCIMVEMSIGDFRSVVWNRRVRTWIFDPPYNVGFKYGSNVNDRMKFQDYKLMIFEAATVMSDYSLDDANLFYINYQENAARTLDSFEAAGWNLKQWISWVYPSNIGMSKNKCTRASRAILWFTKGDPDTNMTASVQPYKNPTDRRIQEQMAKGKKGTHHYDWWQINMRKNVSHGFKGYYNQLPAELVRRIILLTTDEGEVVADLMAGSGSHIEPSISNNRIPYMNDIDPWAMTFWKATLDSLGETYELS